MRMLVQTFRVMCSRVIISVAALTATLIIRTAEPDGRGFDKPEQAVEALRGALAIQDPTQLRQLFGSLLNDIANSDPVAATNEFKAVAAAIQQSHSLLPGGTNRIKLQYGADAEIFPIPLVQSGGKWYFDTAAGVEELINRRIGRNELAVLEIIRTYVQAQREYAAADRDNDNVLEYAQKFASTPGQKDGLYWDLDIDGTRSPLGPLVAEAEAGGYTKKTGTSRRAFHGYYFKILTSQGRNAPGGAYDYIINGNMIGGFALVAWPSEYDQTGVMTFIVNQQGVVLQKDFGPATNDQAATISSYDPDSSWKRSAD
jgi:hypothetical protein